MTTEINHVFKYVNENRGYRASLGVISSALFNKTILAWAAINKDSGEIWVPELTVINKSWPDAQWTPLTQRQASLFDTAYERESLPKKNLMSSI